MLLYLKYLLYTIFHCFCRYSHLLEVSDVSFTHTCSSSFLVIREDIYLYVWSVSQCIHNTQVFINFAGRSLCRKYLTFLLSKRVETLFSVCDIVYYLFSGRSSMLPEVSGGVCSYHIFHIIFFSRHFPLPTCRMIPSYLFVVSAALSRVKKYLI